MLRTTGFVTSIFVSALLVVADPKSISCRALSNAGAPKVNDDDVVVLLSFVLLDVDALLVVAEPPNPPPVLLLPNPPKPVVAACCTGVVGGLSFIFPLLGSFSFLYVSFDVPVRVFPLGLCKGVVPVRLAGYTRRMFFPGSVVTFIFIGRCIGFVIFRINHVVDAF